MERSSAREIYAQARRVVRRCGTRDPFRAAEDMGCIILTVPLKGLRGFYQLLHRVPIIYIADSLDENEARMVCAHELGHKVLHKGLNRIFMDTNTFVVTRRYENEANLFALCLLYSDEDLAPFLTRSLTDAAAMMGVPAELARARLDLIDAKSLNVCPE